MIFVDNYIKVVSLVGPTASGKTKLGVDLAKHFDGEIISADSMQIYREMQIATAKPTDSEMEGIPHHLMGFLPPDQAYSVAKFVEDASRCIEDIRRREKLPVIVGGTGLYVDSLLNHIRFNEEVRNEQLSYTLWQIYEQQGTDRLLQMLDEFDHPSVIRLQGERNPKRIIRAIEFYKTTGITMTEQIAQSQTETSPYQPVKIGLNYRDREKLYERINQRVDNMMRLGLLEEAKGVLEQPLSYTAKMAIGYKELAPYIHGELDLETCIEKLKRETRRYAKRQITWFKRDLAIHWLYVDEYHSYHELFDAAADIVNKGLLYG